MTGPDQLLEQVLHVILGLVLVHTQLFEDDHSLALDVRRIEPRVRNDVEEDVETEGHVLRRNPGPVGRQLFVGRRVDEPADAFNRIRDLLRRRPALGALEEEVLDEVGDARQSFVLEPRASAEHENDARRVALRHRLRDQARTSGQRLDPVRGAHGEAKV